VCFAENHNSSLGVIEIKSTLICKIYTEKLFLRYYNSLII